MIYCVFDRRTGNIRRRFEGPESDADAQLQEGEALYFGDANPVRHRVVETERGLQLIDRRNEDPGDGSTWDEQEGRWVSPIELDIALKLTMTHLEHSSQLRAMREYLLAEPDSQEEQNARARLAALDRELTELRGKLHKRG